ncbi:MAG TPA: hypothetical protein VM074_05580 [Solimonas sp.]|nr:hypothetical protein [Solimonas sp.]
MLLAALALAGAGAVVAAEPNQGPLQVHGFASQGFVLTSGNTNVNGSSSDKNGSFEYHELGVNGSWQPRSNLLLSGQLASVRAGQSVDEYLTIEYALVDYTPFQGSKGRAGMRAGKLKLPIGFYNDTRDVVFTRPGVLLPQGVYLETSGARAFGYFSSIGASLYGDLYLGEHALYLEGAGYVRQNLGETADIAILRRDASGDFKVDRGFTLRLMDDWDGGRARAALSLASVQLSYEASNRVPSASNLFAQDGDLDFKQAVLSLQYNWPAFSLTAEYCWRTFTLDDLIPGPFSSAVDLDPSGAYVQGTYRFSPKWSSFLRYDEQIRDAHDRSGRRQEAESQQASAATGGLAPVQPRHYFFARDWTVGTRYDLRSDLALWSEFHWVDGNAWVNPLDNPGFDRGGAERHWNLFTVMLGYRF